MSEKTPLQELECLKKEYEGKREKIFSKLAKDLHSKSLKKFNAASKKTLTSKQVEYANMINKAPSNILCERGKDFVRELTSKITNLEIPKDIKSREYKRGTFFKTKYATARLTKTTIWEKLEHPTLFEIKNYLYDFEEDLKDIIADVNSK